VIKGPTGKQQVVLPKNILLEISRLGEEGEEIAFCLKEKDNQAVFSLGNLVLSSRFLEGEFPDYEKIIPKTSGIRVRVDKEELLRVVRLAAVFARDSANIVKINLGKDSLKISAESSQSGNQETEIDAKIEGDLPAGGFEIAFNYKFLEEVVKALVGEEVLMEFNNPSSPGVFTDPKDPDYLHLIMPVKVQS
jgi:DNA polymerase-3 subunit beta